MAAEKRMKTVVKLAAKYRTGRSEERQGGGWAQTAMTAAAHKLGKGGKDEFRRLHAFTTPHTSSADIMRFHCPVCASSDSRKEE